MNAKGCLVVSFEIRKKKIFNFVASIVRNIVVLKNDEALSTIYSIKRVLD